MTAPESRASKRRIRAVDRTEEALALRLQGLTYREIGGRLGIAKSSAHEAVTKALEAAIERGVDAAETLRQLELERLDRYLRVIEPKVEIGDLQAVAEARKIMDQRARLLGLHRPTQHEHRFPLDLEGATDEELARIAAGEDPRVVMAAKGAR